MSEPNGAWIEPALSFAAQLAALPQDEQPKAFVEGAATLGITVPTLRRNVLAARHIASHAKGVGMDVKNVVAAALTIEMLIRLERRDPAAAHKIRRPVFQGQIPAREMRERLKAVPERKPRGRHMGEWAASALGIIDMFYNASPASFAKAENSDIGKMLRVDIEVWPPGAKAPHAIFISPLDDMSECAGFALEDQIPFILAACTIYEQVNVALHEDSEGKRLFEILDRMRNRLPAKPNLARFRPDDHETAEDAVDELNR